MTSASTSPADSPNDGVWISTRGGANSGKTSTGMSRIWARPKYIIIAARATTMYRSFRLDPTIQRIMRNAPDRQ